MKLETIVENIRLRPYGRPLLHLLFWAFFFAARCYIGFISINNYQASKEIMLLIGLSNTISAMAVFYPLVYIAWPRFLSKRKWVPGIIFIFCLIIIYTILDYAGEMLLLQNKEWAAIVQQTNPEYYRYLHQDIFSILLKRVITMGIIYQLFVFLALPLAIKLGLAYIRQQLAAAALTKDNLQMEFNFLKSQVNPHFLFNTLNNIYALILHDKKQQATQTVARLSDFMRYSLYETQAEKIPVEKEIKLMMDYVELEKIRLNYTKVNVHVQQDTAEAELPPLLLMPLIENAFKYSADTDKTAFIHISFVIADGSLVFDVVNSFDPVTVSPSQGGIGINNFKKRLAFYYPGKYSCEFSSADNVFSVHVTIDLK
ncbi:MAG: sensor histidine kinase [Bacteroidota bacterium]